MRNKWNFWFVLFILIFPMTAQAVGDSDRQGQLRNSGQRIVTGTIETISNDGISVKTDDGKAVTIIPAGQPDYLGKGLQKGDRIILSFNHRNRLVGIDKIDEGIPYNKDLWLTGNSKIKF